MSTIQHDVSPAKLNEVQDHAHLISGLDEIEADRHSHARQTFLSRARAVTLAA